MYIYIYIYTHIHNIRNAGNSPGNSTRRILVREYSGGTACLTLLA